MFSPNPASSQIAVSVSNIKEDTELIYSIYTVSGSEVLRFRGGLQETIDLTRLAKGSYIIVVSTDQLTSSKNLLIR